MTTAALMERLKARLTHQTHHGKAQGVFVKNEAVIGEIAQNTPNTPNTPQKQGGQVQTPEPAGVAPVWTAPAQPVAVVPPLPKTVQQDPAIARLLALAMALCDRTGASERAREGWRADIEQAAPEHRADLLALVLHLMPKPKAMPAMEPEPAPAPAQTWRQHDKADQAHYWACVQCRAVVVQRQPGDRCPEGQRLSDAYIEAATREGRFIGARVPRQRQNR